MRYDCCDRFRDRFFRFSITITITNYGEVAIALQ